MVENLRRALAISKCLEDHKDYGAIFKIRILYKSGNSHETWMETFRYKEDGNSVSYEWKTAVGAIKPIQVNPDHVEAVYVVDIAAYNKKTGDIYYP